ncbi:hypothetical protein EVAR_43047_1 [Eumeta japonica]|uniref:Uncharacterized protein n=1 Tax=Eumeta variegata TaxID=151549 RepID=A0A4C1XJT0_EUMVA|nr:hypothetical protein EVAR_43047_1 [Eumeta japonica]
MCRELDKRAIRALSEFTYACAAAGRGRAPFAFRWVAACSVAAVRRVHRPTLASALQYFLCNRHDRDLIARQKARFKHERVCALAHEPDRENCVNKLTGVLAMGVAGPDWNCHSPDF